MSKGLRLIFVETLVFIFLPLCTFMYRPEWLQWRVPFMAAALLYVAVVSHQRRYSFTDVFLTKGKKGGFFIMLSITALLAVLLLLLVVLNPRFLYIREFMYESIGFSPLISLFIYAFISAPLQEFLIRGYYLKRLTQSLDHHYLVLILVSLMFGMLHAPFANQWLGLSTFLISFFWTFFVMKYKTIYPVILSHVILGGIIMARSLLLY